MIADHDCPGCGTPGVHHSRLACRRCWYGLPKAIRGEVWDAYLNRGQGSIEHRQAIAKAMAFWREKG